MFSSWWIIGAQERDKRHSPLITAHLTSTGIPMIKASHTVSVSEQGCGLHHQGEEGEDLLNHNAIYYGAALWTHFPNLSFWFCVLCARERWIWSCCQVFWIWTLLGDCVLVGLGGPLWRAGRLILCHGLSLDHREKANLGGQRGRHYGVLGCWAW